jgi:hypothetical protein
VHKLRRRKNISFTERGANGSIISREDKSVIHNSEKTVDVEGINDHCVNDISIVTAGAAIQAHHGPVTAIINEYDLDNQDRTIHSSGQPELHKNDFNYRSKKVGRLQFILMVCGRYSSLDIVQCLPYMTMSRYTTDEYQTLPHVMLASPSQREPAVFDSVNSDDDEWHNLLLDPISVHSDDDEWHNESSGPIDEDKEILLTVNTDDVNHVGATHQFTCAIGDQAPLTIVLDNDEASLIATNRSSKIRMSLPNFDQSRSKFCIRPTKRIEKTFNCITQCGTMPYSKVLLTCDEYLNSRLNIPHRNEDAVTDTVSSDTPAVDFAVTMAQLFNGTITEVSDVFNIKNERECAQTGQDSIRKRGVMQHLVSNEAHVKISNKVKDLIQTLSNKVKDLTGTLTISDRQSTPHTQWQHPAERPLLLDCKRTNANMWLLSLEYACVVLKNTASDKQDRMTLIPSLLGYMPDIHLLLQFICNKSVYHKTEDPQFPSLLKEARGPFVGISENFRHLMTFKFLTDDMCKIIQRSELQSTLHDQKKNLHAVKDSPLKAANVPSDIKSTNEDEYNTDAGETRPMFRSNTSDLFGKTCDLSGKTSVLNEQEDGAQYRGGIVEPFKEDDVTCLSDPMLMKIKVSVNDN